MADWRMKIIAAEAEHLVGLASQDHELRRELRALAERVLAATAGPAPSPGAVPAAAEPAGPAEPATPGAEGSGPHEATVAESGRPRPPLRELTLGRPAPTPKGVPRRFETSSGPEAPDERLAPLEARCRGKAEAARWLATRLHQLRDGLDPGLEDAPADPVISAWTDRVADGFYWQHAPESSQPSDIEALGDLGGCFEAAAEALALVRRLPGHAKAMEPVLPLLAEAQSAVRVAIQRIQAPEDADQVQVFEWLKAATARHRVFLRRFMRSDDPADPAGWPDLLARIEKIAAKHGQARRPSRLEPLFQALRAHLANLRGGEAAEPDWREVIRDVEELVSNGLPPSNRQIRELLLPAINELPDSADLPPGFRLVLREIDRFLATAAAPAESSTQPEPAAEVKQAARLLGGRSVVLIGGSRRREAQQALERALGLKELVWVETKEHQSIDAFEPVVARPDVALVLLAIRWSSHAFGDVKLMCDRHGKALVRLPGGYNANQVATQILAQSSDHLARG
jgi:hypothetical protein